MTRIRIGSATADITPDWPLDLAGFALRTRPSEGVAQPLHVRVAVLETETGSGERSRVVVVSADILWWGPQHLPELRREIAALAGVPEGNILFSATHSHSGPQTSTRASATIGVLDPRFIALLHERTREATRAAVADLEPVSVRRFTGCHDLGFNRRPQFDPDGPTDPILTAIRFARADGSPRTFLVHYTCHPVISQEHVVSGEWPGVAMDILEQELGVTALFLQGCCGDINPVVQGEGRSLRGPDEIVVREGRRLAEAVRALLAGPGEALAPVPLRVDHLEIDLPFAGIPDDATLRGGMDAPGVAGEWRRVLLEHPEWREPTISLHLQRVDIADGLSLLAMNGEVVVSYGLHARTVSNGAVLPMGYSNGMTGYVPTAKVIAEGGYEGGDSIPYFFLPAPFDPAVEPLLTEAIDRLLA
jgi:hypothetical protein